MVTKKRFCGMRSVAGNPQRMTFLRSTLDDARAT